MKDIFKGMFKHFGESLLSLAMWAPIFGAAGLLGWELGRVSKGTHSKALGILALGIYIFVLLCAVIVAFWISEKRSRNRPVKYEPNPPTEYERQESNSNFNRGWLCLLTGLAVWIMPFDTDDIWERLALCAAAAILAWPVTAVRKIKKRPWLYALALLCVWLIYLGGYGLWDGMTHVGPGWERVHIGGSPDMGGGYDGGYDEDENVSQSEYRRDNLNDGLGIGFLGAVAVSALVYQWREKDKKEAQTCSIATKQQSKGFTMPKNTMKTKILIAALGAFFLTCLFPPWLNVLDIPYHAHQRTPAGYAFILFPPDSKSGPWSVEIDLKTLFVEWVALAAITGTIWLFVVKSSWTRNDKSNRSEKLILPPGNPQN